MPPRPRCRRGVRPRKALRPLLPRSLLLQPLLPRLPPRRRHRRPRGPRRWLQRLLWLQRSLRNRRCPRSSKRRRTWRKRDAKNSLDSRRMPSRNRVCPLPPTRATHRCPACLHVLIRTAVGSTACAATALPVPVPAHRIWWLCMCMADGWIRRHSTDECSACVAELPWCGGAVRGTRACHHLGAPWFSGKFGRLRQLMRVSS